jgi:hypothetical protein
MTATGARTEKLRRSRNAVTAPALKPRSWRAVRVSPEREESTLRNEARSSARARLLTIAGVSAGLWLLVWTVFTLLAR